MISEGGSDNEEEVVVDGQNNCWRMGGNRHFRTKAVLVVLRGLKKRKQKGLVWLPDKYTQVPKPQWMLSKPAYNTHDPSILKDVKDLYSSPAGVDDDHFWLQAAWRKRRKFLCNDLLKMFKLKRPSWVSEKEYPEFLEWLESAQIQVAFAVEEGEDVAYFVEKSDKHDDLVVKENHPDSQFPDVDATTATGDLG
eukprot:Cvel_35664.t1-p1 / transcript=Cvel_35664.t1 / gene=Cvel_35664 / organism=Chromera_velia_CCMP2878 / gene_product=hypothetical protein / transcript_product=hypothetical protein / location=Cvel_scaffold6616:2024-2733(+) / protein_length=193 / sequence_SO=supercontig / SO=protein_coding / is_pseudo=false